MNHNINKEMGPASEQDLRAARAAFSCHRTQIEPKFLYLPKWKAVITDFSLLGKREGWVWVRALQDRVRVGGPASLRTPQDLPLPEGRRGLFLTFLAGHSARRSRQGRTDTCQFIPLQVALFK